MPQILPPLPPELRARLCALDPRPHSGVALGDAAVDAHLPAHGLGLGQLHEIGAAGADGGQAASGALAAAFAACLLARLPGTRPILWIATVCDLYPHGLAACGLDPARLIFVQALRNAEVLAAMETALREGTAAAVLGEVGIFQRLAARRLQLACRRQGSTGFVLRRCLHGAAPARGETEGNAAATRWRLAPWPSESRDREPGPARWRVELLQARGGRPGAWIMELAEAPRGMMPRGMMPRGMMADMDATPALRVVAVLADPAPAPPPRLRVAG